MRRVIRNIAPAVQMGVMPFRMGANFVIDWQRENVRAEWALGLLGKAELKMFAMWLLCGWCIAWANVLQPTSQIRTVSMYNIEYGLGPAARYWLLFYCGMLVPSRVFNTFDSRWQFLYTVALLFPGILEGRVETVLTPVTNIPVRRFDPYELVYTSVITWISGALFHYLVKGAAREIWWAMCFPKRYYNAHIVPMLAIMFPPRGLR